MDRIEDRARKAFVFSRHVTHIEDDVGNCWRKVGAILRVSTPTIRNIDEDKVLSRDKAWEVLDKWKQQEGNDATVGRLVDALEKIERKDIAQKLLEFAVKEVRMEELQKEKEKEEMKTEISNARKSSAELVEEVCLVTECLEKEQQTQKKTLEKLEEVKKSLHEFELFIAKVENDKEIIDTRIQQLKTTITGLEEKLSTEKSEKESYVKKAENLRKLYNQMDHDLRILKEKFEKITEGDKESDQSQPDDNNNVLNETPNHRDMLEGNHVCSRCQQGVQIVDLVEEIKDDPMLRLQGEMKKKEEYKKKIEELEKKEERMKKQHDNKIDKSNKEIEKLKEENKKLKLKKIKTEGNETSELEKARKERDQLSSTMKQLDKQLSDSQVKREKLKEENAKYEKKCLALSDELEACKTKIESGQDEIEQLELKQETLEDNIKKRDTEIARLSAFNTVRERQLQKTIADLKKEKEDVELSLRSEKKKMKRELPNNNEYRKRPEEAACGDEVSIEAIKKLKEEKKNLDGQIKNETEKLKKIQNEREQLHKEVLKLKEEILKFRNRVSRVFLPSGKDFSSSPGVVFALKKRDRPICATRSSHGSGEASDIFGNRGKTSGTKSEEGSWWCIDLSKNYLLAITHYALRHGKSDGESYLKEWQLQGSVDGDTWKNLETSGYSGAFLPFSEPYPYFTGTWSVTGEVKAFRYFRILQKGRNSSRNYSLYLSGFELYGVLLEM